MSFGGIFDVATKEQRLAALDTEMAQPSFWDDNRRAQEVIRERTELSRLVTRVKELTTKAEDLTVLLELAEEATDGSLDAEIAEGVAGLRKELDEYELKIMLSGPHDTKAAIVSIHPGAGGTESQDWAQMLLRMYLRWCEREGMKAEVVDLLPGDEAGIKSATVEVSGEYAFGFLRGETGVHRLVRISPFDASRRRQTSFASVAVVPEVDDVEINVREDDLRIDVFRASGPGGQGVNTADSAVRITHLPTGIVVECQDDRSQHRNRAQAMSVLASRLVDRERRERQQKEAAHRKSLIGSGDRSERIRTYNFPQGRVTDHRINLTLYKIDAIMQGDLDELIGALAQEFQAEQLAAFEA